MTGVSIRLAGVGKYYRLYASPRDRLKEALMPFGRDYHTRFHALQGIDLQVVHGEVLGVVGRNGSGKSTLVKLMAGLIQPTSGEIELNGVVSPVSDLGAGFNPDFTGAQNVEFRTRMAGSAGLRERIEAACEFAELGDFLHRPLRTYSSGMKARLGFALSMLHDPDVLLLDEVLAVGDLKFRRKCFRRVESLIAAGRTVVMVAHDPQVLVQFCSRAILLEGGQLVASGSPKAVIDEYQRLLFAGEGDHTGPRSSPGSRAAPELATVARFETESRQINPEFVQFLTPRLLDESGAEQAVLTQGRRYTVTFGAEFNRAMSDVSIGVQIKTVSGLLVSGANLKDFQHNVIHQVSARDAAQIEWSFDCSLTPGAYCVRLFATGTASPESVLEDAVLFKVGSVQRLNGGLVNLKQDIQYVFLAGEQQKYRA